VLNGVGINAQLPVSQRCRIGEVVCTNLTVHGPTARRRGHVRVNRAFDSGDACPASRAALSRFHIHPPVPKGRTEPLPRRQP
jgi:hypothetical protein